MCTMSECIELYFGGADSRTVKDLFPAMWFIANACLTIAVNSCDPERYFSVLKLIKSRLRSSMGEKHLDMLMELKLNCSAINSNEFYEKCVKYWYSVKPRKVCLHANTTWDDLKTELNDALATPSAQDSFDLFGSGFVCHTFGDNAAVTTARTKRLANKKKLSIQCAQNHTLYPLLADAHPGVKRYA